MWIERVTIKVMSLLLYCVVFQRKFEAKKAVVLI